VIYLCVRGNCAENPGHVVHLEITRLNVLGVLLREPDTLPLHALFENRNPVGHYPSPGASPPTTLSVSPTQDRTGFRELNHPAGLGTVPKERPPRN